MLLTFDSANIYCASALISISLKLDPADMGLGLDYNELKLIILQVLSRRGPMDSSSLASELSESRPAALDIHALRMALMRYYKQGLLTRERSGGMFTYALTDRGVRRLRWLEQQGRGTDR